MTDADRHPAIDVRGLTVVLDGRTVLGDVDLLVPGGQLVALLGANGAGKSTLVRSIVGLVPAAAGEVRLFGTPRDRFRQWGRVGFVPQRLTATTGVPATVIEVASAGRLARHRPFTPLRAVDRAAIRRALAAVALEHRAHDPVSSLSGGQQQRVLIARALAAEPDLLILDEPTAGVDLVTQQTFSTLLRGFLAAGGTVLLVAHELGLLEPLVDRAVWLRSGGVAYDGAPAGAPLPHVGQGDVHPHAAQVGESERRLWPA